MEGMLPPLYSASGTWYQGLVQYLVEMGNLERPHALVACFFIRLHRQGVERHRKQYPRLKDDWVSSLVMKVEPEDDG